MNEALQNRLYFCLLLAAAWILASFVTWPFLNYEMISPILDIDISSPFLELLRGRLSILANGIKAFLAATIFVELLSLMIPKLDRWRDAGALGRAKMNRLSLKFALAIAFVQALGIITFFSIVPEDPFLLRSKTLIQLECYVMTLAVLFLILWSIAWNHRKGLGHGISLFIFVFTLQSLIQTWSGTDLSAYGSAGRVYFINGIWLILTVAGIILVETRPLTPKQGAWLPLRHTSAGLWPVLLTAHLANMSTIYFADLTLQRGKWWILVTCQRHFQRISPFLCVPYCCLPVGDQSLGISL